MNVRRVQLAERLRSNLWLVPLIITGAGSLAAVLLIELDRRTKAAQIQLPWTFQGGASSAQIVLSTIAGSMITVAGTVYSITIVALTLASTQFAPRVLRTFMRDRSNQVVLGFFVATFTYCVLVLQSIRSVQESEFVPGAAVSGGVFLALVSLALLIYFIDHISRGIRVSSIIASIAHETLNQIHHLYPEPGQEGRAEPPPEAPTADWVAIAAIEAGYIQYIDYDLLLEVATSADIVLREEHAIGAFVIPGTPLAFVTPAARLTSKLAAQVNAAFACGHSPTLQQDVAYGLRQIVDIALKAISPAVNDPTTALNCIDHLGVILAALSVRQHSENACYDTTGRLRILTHSRTFHDLVRLAFDQIRHYGASDPIILLRLLDTITALGGVTRNPAHRAVLGQQINKILTAAQRQIADADELEAVRAHAEEARQACIVSALPVG